MNVTFDINPLSGFQIIMVHATLPGTPIGPRA